MDRAGLSLLRRRLFFTWEKELWACLQQLVMKVCKWGPSDKRSAVFLGRPPLLQEREPFPWPAVAVPTSGGEMVAAKEPRGMLGQRDLVEPQ